MPCAGQEIVASERGGYQRRPKETKGDQKGPNGDQRRPKETKGDQRGPKETKGDQRRPKGTNGDVETITGAEDGDTRVELGPGEEPGSGEATLVNRTNVACSVCDPTLRGLSE